MAATCLAPVSIPFHGDTIVCVQPESAPPAIVLRRTCEAMGVDYDGQLTRLKRHPWATTSVMKVVAEDGKAREMVVIDRRTFAMWLATIDTSRLSNPEAVRQVTLYQCEAAEALDRHFFGAPSAPATGLDLMIRQAKEIVAILERQAEQGMRLDFVEAKANEAAAKADAALAIVTGDTGFMTVKGFCNVRKIKLADGEMSRVGSALSRYCREHAIEIKETRSERWGKENLYPVEILELWAERKKVAS